MTTALRLVAVIATTLVAASQASAHVHVTAPSAPAGANTVFTVGVPNERSDAATVQVALRIPPEFRQVRPVTARGWRVARSRDGDATVLTWSGGRISGTDRVEHRFRAVAPPPGSYSIPAAQTYDDGQVVRWIGGPDAEFPAPVVTIGGDGGTSRSTTPAHTVPTTPAPTDEETVTATATDAATDAGDDGGDARTGAVVGGAVAIVLVGAATGVLIRRRRGNREGER